MRWRALFLSKKHNRSNWDDMNEKDSIAVLFVSRHSYTKAHGKIALVFVSFI